MPMLEIDGLAFHYQQQGDGAEVVLIHAFTSNLSIWAMSGVVEPLARHFRVTTYDLRGHGLSGVTPSGYTSAQMAEDFSRIHEHLQLGPAHVVGHSFGGVIAVHAALEYPEIVSSVILSDSYFPGLRHLEPDMGQTEVWSDLREKLQTVGTDIGDRVDFNRLFQELSAWTQEQKSAARQHLAAPTTRWLEQLAPLADTRAGEETFEVSDLTAARICEVRQPVVALYDEFSPFESTRQYLEENLTDCQAELVPGAKHLAPIQNPIAFVQLVQKHLQRLSH